jgi:hypothetical protein
MENSKDKATVGDVQVDKVTIKNVNEVTPLHEQIVSNVDDLDEFKDEQGKEDDIGDLGLGGMTIAESNPIIDQSVKFPAPGKSNGYLFLFRARPPGAKDDSFTTSLKNGSSTYVKSLQFLCNHLKRAGFDDSLSTVSLADTFPCPDFTDEKFKEKEKLSSKEKDEVKKWLKLLLDLVKPKKVVVFGKDASSAVSELLLGNVPGNVPIDLNSGSPSYCEGIQFTFAPHPSSASRAKEQYDEEYSEILKKVIGSDFNDQLK